eukprot:3141299-Prymnesium_polylepis.1
MEKYKACLFEGVSERLSIPSLISKKHRIFLQDRPKASLSRYDDKRIDNAQVEGSAAQIRHGAGSEAGMERSRLRSCRCDGRCDGEVNFVLHESVEMPPRRRSERFQLGLNGQE